MQEGELGHEERLERAKYWRKRWLRISHNPKITKQLSLRIKKKMTLEDQELSQSPKKVRYVNL